MPIFLKQISWFFNHLSPSSAPSNRDALCAKCTNAHEGAAHIIRLRAHICRLRARSIAQRKHLGIIRDPIIESESTNPVWMAHSHWRKSRTNRVFRSDMIGQKKPVNGVACCAVFGEKWHVHRVTWGLVIGQIWVERGDINAPEVAKYVYDLFSATFTREDQFWEIFSYNFTPIVFHCFVGTLFDIHMCALLFKLSFFAPPVASCLFNSQYHHISVY